MNQRLRGYGTLDSNTAVGKTEEPPSHPYSHRVAREAEGIHVAHWLSVQELASQGTLRLTLQAVAVVLCYLVVSVLFYCHTEHWTVVDATYFAVVTLTMVGYGDLYPHTSIGKLFCILMAFSAVTLIALAVGVLLDHFLAAAVAVQRRSPARVAAELLAAVGAILLAGALPYCLLEGASWLDGMYWATVTMTTIGYGDSFPKSQPGRIFATVYILAGTLLTARAFSSLSRLPIQLRQRRMEEAVERQFGDQLSPEEYRVIARQVTMLKLRTPEFRGVSQSDFTLAMLVSTGKVTTDDIEECLDAFQRLDAKHDGYLDHRDILH